MWYFVHNPLSPNFMTLGVKIGELYNDTKESLITTVCEAFSLMQWSLLLVLESQRVCQLRTE